MSNKTESQVLAEAFESVRNLTKFYLQNLKDEDLTKELEFNGKKFNSAYNIIAHLVWTEHFLIVQGVGNKEMDIPWLNEYGFGFEPSSIKQKPEYKEILSRLDEVHTEAMKILNELPDEELEKPNHINATFGQKNSKLGVIRHCIRHEPMHVGQISWIIKAAGGKMV
jgi:uncharacterized damage-inducible protein DinB